MAYIFKSIAATQFLSNIRDRAISSDFLTHRVVQDYPMPRGKISIFATLRGHLGFSGK